MMESRNTNLIRAMCASALRREVQKTRKNVAGRAEFQMQRDPERLSGVYLFNVVVTVIGEL